MPDQIVADTAAGLRAAADFIEANPQLPLPYVTTGAAGTADLHWFLMLAQYDMDPADQGAAALTIFDAIGGTWNQHEGLDAEDQPAVTWKQDRDRLRFHVEIRREIAEVTC